MTTTEPALRFREDEAPLPPLASHRYRRRVRLPVALRALWQSREMVRSLAEREMRARYKQTFLGVAWAVITPITLMLVFTLFFRRVATVDTQGAPYVIFAYLGLLPWGFFSMSVAQGGISLLLNVSLLHKVSFPREVFPLGSVVLATVDTLIALSALVVLMIVKGFVPHAASLWLPVLWLIAIAFTVGVVLSVSSIVVYFRDLGSTLPLALQLGLFATPVAYGLEAVPQSFRMLYVIVNPLAAVIDGSRRAVLHGDAPLWSDCGPAAASAGVVLLLGYLLFKRLETGIADTA
jgi:ABC-type polysaccharide/polyol phosphate export permease